MCHRAERRILSRFWLYWSPSRFRPEGKAKALMSQQAASRGYIGPIGSLENKLAYVTLLSSIWLLLTLGFASAQSFNGTSVTFGEAFHIQGCPNVFVVSSPTGYSIILWVGGAPVLDRDLLSGDLKKVGRAILTNHTRKQNTAVYVEQSYLSLQAFRSRTARGCPT